MPVIDWKGLGVTPPEGSTRASESGQVSSATRYEQWLRDQPAARQDEILGPGRGRLFRGGATLEQMVRSDGSIITLEELRRAG